MSPGRPSLSAGASPLAIEIRIQPHRRHRRHHDRQSAGKRPAPRRVRGNRREGGAVRHDPDPRALVVAGTGRHFVAGATSIISPRSTARSAERYVLEIQRMQDPGDAWPAGDRGSERDDPRGRVRTRPACDIRIAEEQVELRAAGGDARADPGAPGIQNAAPTVPLGRAKRLLFTGERISAHEALRSVWSTKWCQPGRASSVPLARRDDFRECTASRHRR